MQFQLIHEVGNRQRWKTTSTLSDASAALIADDISAIDGIEGVKVNPRTGSVTVTFACVSAKKALVDYLAGLEVRPPIMRDERKALLCQARKAPVAICRLPAGVDTVARIWTNAFESMPLIRMVGAPIKALFTGAGRMMRAAKDDGALDFSPLVNWFCVRPFMPLMVNVVNAVLGSIPYLIKGVAELRHGKLTVEVLDAAAIGVSLLLRDFRTAGLVVLLLGLGELLESYTRKKSLDSLADQLALKIDTVWVRRGDAVVECALKDIADDDIIVVRAGSTIPVDGKVVAGEAAVNQATMTGEALAVHRCEGGVVFAGTVVEDGEIDIMPTQKGGETRLSKIIEFIETSEQSKAGIQGKAERLADAIVPYNFALAGLVYLFTRNLTRTAAVLLVDYSCALRLATPLAILTSMKEGIKNGMLVKGGRYLEALAEVDTIVFDKTGTLTRSNPELSDVVSLDSEYSDDDLLSLAACLEEHFPHPVSRAVVAAAEQKGLDHFNEEHDAEIKYVVAHGICSSVDGKKVVIGSRHFIADDEGVDCSAAVPHVERLAKEGKSILYMACGSRLIGILGIIDPLREEAADVIAQLKDRGIKRVVMLTGDDEKTAAAVAARLGLTEYRAQVLPTDKAMYVQQLKDQGCKVLMIGDGINDSPALSVADVGATLREGSAIAQEVADVVLTRNSLNELPKAIDLGRATMSRIHQNFTVSVGLNSVFMGGGLFGFIQPALGAVLHNLTTIGVCLNAMRSPLDHQLRMHDVVDGLKSAFLSEPEQTNALLPHETAEEVQ
ncbi:MAG: heavy metal translocating P-type ATPase [Sutterellaceae bacterium]|nr:heavy metal translocating P-type ATPase [Sutterellaceae bacterium]